MKEEEIRPQKIFDEYLRLAELDTQTFFNGVEYHDIQCPACGSKGERAFNKCGFDYSSCPDCSTLYVSPRPESGAFKRYYTEAPSVKESLNKFSRTPVNMR